MKTHYLSMYFSNEQIPYNLYSIKIYHNLNYPLWHLEDVLFPLFAKDYTYDSLRETILSANHIWCAYEYGQCIGCALMTDIGTNGGLYMMLFGIKKSAQGRGIGKHLLDSIVIWSYVNRHKFIYLHTEYDNKKAIRMYENAGFRRESYQSGYVGQLPRFGSDAIPMMLVLI
jgi:ribosomal protein S18 acetylase RimI-like enzyme